MPCLQIVSFVNNPMALYSHINDKELQHTLLADLPTSFTLPPVGCSKLRTSAWNHILDAQPSLNPFPTSPETNKQKRSSQILIPVVCIYVSCCWKLYLSLDVCVGLFRNIWLTLEINPLRGELKWRLASGKADRMFNLSGGKSIYNICPEKTGQNSSRISDGGIWGKVFTEEKIVCPCWPYARRI